jgi:hypothetical protein
MAAAKVEIIYEAEATSLKATVNEVNKANDAIEASVKETSKELSNSLKEVGKSFVGAFAGTEVKKSLADNNKAFEQLNKSSKPLTQVLRGLKNELNALEEAGKGGTAQFRQLEIEAARLEDQIGDTRARVRILASDTFKFDAAVGAIQGLASGFELAQGAAALFGEENEDLQKALIKITAATAVANSVQQIAILLKEENATKTLIQTKAEAAYAAVVGTSTGALKAFRIALAATGIGLVIVAIGALIANFDKLKDAIFGTSDTTRALKATLEGVRTAQAEAIEQTSKVGTAFELARKGVISKDEALLTYNETLGDSFGKTNDLNVAEANYVKKKDAFIQATAARAQAQALLAQSAALAAEAATVTGEQATNFGEKIQTFIGDAFGVFNKLIGNTAAVTAASLKANTLIVEQNAKERVQTEKTAQAEILTNLATSKLAEAEVIENGAGIASEAEQKIRDQREEAAKKAAEAAKELAKAERQANIDRSNELAELQKGFDNQVAEERKKNEAKLQVELTDLADTSLETQLDTRLAFLRTLEIEEGSSLDRRINIIELEAQKRQDAIRNSVADQTLANKLILEDQAKTEQAIRDERKKSRDEAIDQAFEIASASADALGSILKFQSQLTENRIAEIQSTSEKELEAINSSLESEVVKANKREALEKRTQSKIAAEKQKQARQEKALNIFRATIDTAASIVKTGAQLGYPAALPFQILAGIVGAANIAAIAAQPLPKFKKGGMVGGRSHEAGGTLIEAERGEYVVNKNSVMRNRRELDAINTSSAAFKRLIDERYVRPAILSYAMNNKRDGITVNASLNSKAMEKELKGLRKDMRNKNTIVNINGGDSRYTWQ